MIVDSALYRAGVRVPIDCHKSDFEALRREADRDDEFVWIGLHEPTVEEMSTVSSAFQLHPLAVEDSLQAHQRPKLETFGDMTFLVLKTLWYVDASDAVETGQVTVFVGKGFVISVRQGEGAHLHDARLNLERETEVLGHGPSAVLYTICDRVVDEYERVADELQTDVEEIEESVFSPGRSQDSRRIYVLKRELAEMRRAVTPLRGPMERFSEGAVQGVSTKSAPFFGDVRDHVLRVTETVDTLDALLSTAFDAHLARITVEQNSDMRKISAWVAIAGVNTLVAGIYGMNFRYMPELHWHYAYYVALLFMAAVSLALWRAFKHTGWL